jgi:hypothetical protein
MVLRKHVQDKQIIVKFEGTLKIIFELYLLKIFLRYFNEIMFLAPNYSLLTPL